MTTGSLSGCWPEELDSIVSSVLLSPEMGEVGMGLSCKLITRVIKEIPEQLIITSVQHYKLNTLYVIHIAHFPPIYNNTPSWVLKTGTVGRLSC
jgi:hypothetical protein